MKLPFLPIQAGYSQTPGSESASVALEGGRAWRRKTKANSSSLVTATWIFNQLQLDVFWAFFRVETARGVLPFTMDLILEDSSLQDVTCWFVGEPGTPTLQGLNYTVTAQLEVQRPAYSAALDASIVDSYLAYGEGVGDMFDRLAIFANEDLPDTIGA